MLRHSKAKPSPLLRGRELSERPSAIAFLKAAEETHWTWLLLLLSWWIPCRGFCKEHRSETTILWALHGAKIGHVPAGHWLPMSNSVPIHLRPTLPGHLRPQWAVLPAGTGWEPFSGWFLKGNQLVNYHFEDPLKNSDAQWMSMRKNNWHLFWLVEFNGEPFPNKKKKGHHWATGKRTA